LSSLGTPPGPSAPPPSSELFRKISVGDFNSDGNPDLAITIDNQDFVSILLGNGKGGFSDPPVVNLGISQDAVVVADFDSDGVQDLAALNFGVATAGGVQTQSTTVISIE
jgi:hypothetical protein